MSKYFSQQYRSSYNKFLLASSLSIFVSLFQVTNFSFLGGELDKLDTQVLSFLLFVVGIWSGLSFLLTYLDERRELSKIDSDLSRYLGGIQNSINSLKNERKDLDEVLTGHFKGIEDFSDLAIKFLEDQFRQAKKYEYDEVKSRAAHNVVQILDRSYNDHMDMLRSIRGELDSLTSNAKGRLKSIEAKALKLESNINTIDQIELGLIKMKSFPIWVKLRVFTMEKFTPLMLFFMMITAYFFTDRTLCFLKYVSSIGNG